MAFKKHTDCNLWNLSHVHEKNLLVSHVSKCARCGVLFAPPVAYKGIAISCKRNSLRKKKLLFVLQSERKEHLITVPAILLMTPKLVSHFEASHQVADEEEERSDQFTHLQRLHCCSNHERSSIGRSRNRIFWDNADLDSPHASA